MRRLQSLRWGGSVLSPQVQMRSSRFSPRTLPSSCSGSCVNERSPQAYFTAVRQSSTAANSLRKIGDSEHDDNGSRGTEAAETDAGWSSAPPSPAVSAASTSSRLSALHARLSFPARLPLETLARTLVHRTADPSLSFNNSALAVLGNDLLNYYTCEFILTTYPRLPTAILWSAMNAYIGPKTLTSITREWGVEYAAEPGAEVDPGLLQFKRLPPGYEPPTPAQETRARNKMIVLGNAFGENASRGDLDLGATPEQACSSFVHAVLGALYLHAGRPAAKAFFTDYFTSRKLAMADLFAFTQPVRDLKKLCAREGFEPPVARILSETGRISRHPVFNIGIFSGNDKLGEGSGASLNEGRTRAAVAALKSWYLYSPLAPRVPSSMEEAGAEPWTPALVDPGEVIV
ncbi:hypothetical protein KEM54_000453 [Ascosphaera aggregata]|nr:hypothetical protein KEM54_000453 [Ascosphaera aggregata]